MYVAPLKKGQGLLGQRSGFGLIARDDIHHSVAALNLYGADLLRRKLPQTTAFNHGGASHSDAGTLGGNTNIRRAKQRRVAGETVAIVDRDARHFAFQSRPLRKGGNIQTGKLHQHIGIAGAATPALGVHHYGQVFIPSQG